MEYVFGTKGGTEVLKTKGRAHTSLTGWQQVEQVHQDRETVTDSFWVVRKLDSAEDAAGNCYDWYEIDRHYRTVDRSGPIAAKVARTTAAAEIAFVTLAEAGTIDEETAGEHAELFAEWAENVSYKAGDIRRRGLELYRCIQGHTSQAGWEPENAASLWKKTADPAEEWPSWSQPVGANDAYSAGDKVSHNGKRWVSTADGNVWEPGVYGWEEQPLQTTKENEL